MPAFAAFSPLGFVHDFHKQYMGIQGAKTSLYRAVAQKIGNFKDLPVKEGLKLALCKPSCDSNVFDINKIVAERLKA